MSDTVKLFKNFNCNLNEDVNDDIDNMTMEEMIKKYAEICEEAGSGLSYFEVLEQLNNYDCLNTSSFRNMLKDTIDYLNDNN